MGVENKMETPDMRKRYSVILLLVSIAVYANTLFNNYVLDDIAVISRNNYVAKGIAGIKEILTTPSLSGFVDRTVYGNEPVNDIYRPVSLVMFAIERQLFGEVPVAGHLINLLLFAGCVWLLFLFLSQYFGQHKIVLAFIAALLFAVHPIHTEVVANTKSRDELLCFFFAFSALILFQRYAAGSKLHFLLAGTCCFFLSLLSKETSISLLVLTPVIFLYNDANRKRTTFITISAIVAATAYLYIRYSILSAHNANHSQLIAFMENPLTGAPSAASRIATAIEVMGYYIRLLFIPYPLCSDYTFASIPFVTFGDVTVWISIVVYVLLVVYALYRFLTKKNDVYAIGIFFFLITIALFSNIPFLTGAIMAERFLFFPSVGYCLVVAGLLQWVASKVPGAKNPWVFIAPIAIVFAILAVKRNAEWSDNYTLVKADIQKYPQNARLWHSLGYMHATEGVANANTETERKELYLEGIDCMEKSLSIYPKQFKVHADIGNAFVALRQFDSAERHMLLALSLKPGDPVFICALGGVYFNQQKYGQTLGLCRQALEKVPANAAILNNIALCHLQMAQYDSAIYFAEKVQQIEPANTLAGATLDAAKKQKGILPKP